MALSNWRTRVRSLKRDTYALYLAARDPGTPWLARLLVVLIVAYALSPIDLIPDFIPVLGLLDDLLLLPLGLALAIHLIPPDVLRIARQQAAQQEAHGRPVSRIAAVVIIAIWVLAAFVVGRWIAHALGYSV